jgi:hypothetical protein
MNHKKLYGKTILEILKQNNMSQSNFEATFRKYTKLVVESASSGHKEMTQEQNAALKSLYIIIRDCLEDIYYEARREKINSKNCESKFPKFLEKYQPKNPYITAYNHETLKLELPSSIKDCFKDLRDDIEIKIVSKDKPIMKAGKGVISKAGLSRHGKTDEILGLYFRFDILLDDFNELKAGLQHELQHIHMRGNVEGLKNAQDKFHGFIDYLGDNAEICAYAKEYAYRYHKKYPRDSVLSIDKLKKLFSNPKWESLNNYMLFGEDESVIKDKHDVSSADIKKMKKIHGEFVETVKNSLNYYL